MKFDSNKALRNKSIYYKPLEKYLCKVFLDTIYMPIAKIIREDIGKEWIGFHNSKEDLIKALKTGTIQYTEENHFEGNFNAQISREIKRLGGKWDKKWKRWYLPADKLPFNVRSAIGQSSQKFKSLQTKIDSFLSELQRVFEAIGEDSPFEMEGLFGKQVVDLNRGFERGLKGLLVPPELDSAMIEQISKDYSNNMNLYIKKWTFDSIKRLRKKVQENAFKGYRAQQLVEIIKKDYNTSENKAKFLARQETALLMSKFREERYKSAGVQRYRWSTSKDARVRDRHQLLEGQVFTWDNPPIVDEQGHRKHPGEDWNCRCLAIPILG